MTMTLSGFAWVAACSISESYMVGLQYSGARSGLCGTVIKSPQGIERRRVSLGRMRMGKQCNTDKVGMRSRAFQPLTKDLAGGFQSWVVGQMVMIDHLIAL